MRLWLIAPNGTAIDYYQMDTELDNPDFSDIDSVVYNYTVDISSFDKGFWHYYFTTMDNGTQNKVFYPKEGYFMGGSYSENSDITAVLFGSRVSTSNDSYYTPDGFISDEFSFFIKWWDWTNSSTPLNVSLCLIPGNITDNIGDLKRNGVRNFEMQTVSSTPNYSDPVEYYVTLDFIDLEYGGCDIGTFYHYFEAFVNDSTIRYDISYNTSYVCYNYGPTLKSELKPDIEIISYCPSQSGVIGNGEYISYLMIFSDYDGIGPSDTPKIILNGSKGVSEYEMRSIYNSTDGSTRKYYLKVDSDDLEPGEYKVIFNVEYDGEPLDIDSETFDCSKLTVLFSFRKTFQAVNLGLALCGTLPMAGGFVVAGVLATGKGWSDIAALGVASLFLGSMIGGVASLMKSFSSSGNIEGLIGLGIASLCTLLAVTIHPDSPSLISWFHSHASFMTKLFKYLLIGSLISCLFVSSLASSFFTLVSTSLSLVWNIFSIFPAFIGILNLAFTYSLMCSVLTSCNKPEEDSEEGLALTGKFGGLDLGGLFKAPKQNFKYLMTYKTLYSSALLVISGLSFYLAANLFFN